MSHVTVVAQVIAKNESVAAAKTELLKLIAPTRKENGCIGYDLHQDLENPALFIFYETWENLAALEKHMNTEHFKVYIAAVDGLIADKVVYKMTRIE